MTTIFFPLDSVVFYPDGNSQGNIMENSGKQNPKMGFKSPPSRGGNSANYSLAFQYSIHK
jgi:hypothetical protein